MSDIKEILKAVIDDLEVDRCSDIQIRINESGNTVEYDVEANQKEETDNISRDLKEIFSTPQEEMLNAIMMADFFGEHLLEVLGRLDEIVDGGDAKLFNNLMKDLTFVGKKNYTLQVIEK